MHPASPPSAPLLEPELPPLDPELDPELLPLLDPELLPLLDPELLPLLDPELLPPLDPELSPAVASPTAPPPSSMSGTSGNPTMVAHAEIQTGVKARSRKREALMPQNDPCRSIPPPPGPTLGANSTPVAGCCDAGCAVKNSTAPPTTSAPPAMKPTVEIVLSVIPVEWSLTACA